MMNRSSSVPYLSNSKAVNMRLYKTKMCSFHLNGVCERGNFCTYAHSTEELNTTMMACRDAWEPGVYSCTESFTGASTWSDPTPVMSPERSPSASSCGTLSIAVEDLMPTVAFLGDQVNELRDELHWRNAFIMTLLKLLSGRDGADEILSGESPPTREELLDIISYLGSLHHTSPI
ncbi:Molybdopterin synthase catalytic subunit [Perkinsus olseni]|uniref:Molybdopterin synthase catalytic subunit n=2 Tax=Perkinsus olseni TaxID=32597 RepID=A0A7J6T1Q3_PEROL|nr:Molybdopterin synthase catalytic subunit [Perkinsus olseni]KAF4755132.1 Molybdopterin synthase catalytic subunit [Perkinsus olseni]